MVGLFFEVFWGVGLRFGVLVVVLGGGLRFGGFVVRRCLVLL